MKITFVTYIYPYPERGYNPGIERVVQELARELDQQGHEVHVLTTFRNGGKSEYERDDGVHIHRTPDTRHYFGRAGSLFSLDMLSLNYSIRSHAELLESSDIVHTFTPLVWNFFSTPLVAHYHHWDEPDDPIEYLYLPTSHRLWMRSYEIADRVAAVSEYSAHDLANRGFNGNKIEIIPNGVDTDTYHPGESDIEFEDWDSVILYVGPLMERKGLKYLIHAMRDVLKEFPDTGLVLVGSGDRIRLDLLAEDLGVRENIRFTGFVSDNDLPEYYRAADIFVLPSLLEGFGMVLLEAMASGCAIVSTTTSAIPEVVDDAGVLVPPRDAQSLAYELKSLISNPKRRQVIQDDCLARAQGRFTWSASAEWLVDVYESAIRD